MIFAELKVGEQFRVRRWDGITDPKCPTYEKINPFQFGRRTQNALYHYKRNGLARVGYVFSRTRSK